MVDKVQVIQNIYDGFLEGRIYLDYVMRLIEEFKNDLIKWDDLKEKNAESDEFLSLTEKLYSKILMWRMEGRIENKLNTEDIERRLHTIELDYKQIKKDVGTLLSTFLEKQQIDENSRNIESGFHAVG